MDTKRFHRVFFTHFFRIFCIPTPQKPHKSGHYSCPHGRLHDSRRPQAPRRPLRMRTVQGAPGTAAGAGRRGRCVRDFAPAGPGEEPRRPGSRRVEPAVLPAGRLRGHPRQRRHHRVLGRGRVRADRQAFAAPDLRRVQQQVRLGGGQEPVRRRPDRRQGRSGQRPQTSVGPVRRPHRMGAQRNLHGRRGSRAATRGLRAAR